MAKCNPSGEVRDVANCDSDFNAKDVAHCDLDIATDGLKLARDISSHVGKCDSHAAIHHVVESAATRLVIVIRKGAEYDYKVLINYFQRHIHYTTLESFS